MNTKKMISAALAAFAAVACETEYVGLSEKADDSVQLEVRLPSKQTKAQVAGIESENAVNDLQVFVFDHNKMLEAYGQSSTSTLKVSCSSGQKEIVALVNAKPLTDVVSMTDLAGRRTLLSDNSVGSFVMEGSTVKTLTTASTVEIPVKRIASRVALTGISVDFELEQHNAQTFQVNSIYLVNVAGDRTYLNAGKPESWCSKMTYESSAPSVTNVTLTNTFISNVSAYTKTHYLYCYPNPTSNDASGGTWSARHTRLVVEAELGGKKYYYPVTLPELKSNTAYSVSMKITRPGSASPDKPVDSLAATFSVSVQPWDDEIVLNETI